MNRSKLLAYLNCHLPDGRIKHSLGVEQSAILLAKRFGYDEDKAAIAGLMHDCAKWMDDEEYIRRALAYGVELDEVMRKSPVLLHGHAAAHVLKHEFDIKDQEILDAVCYHCLPRLDPTGFDMVVAVADLIEEGRTYPGVEDIRKLAQKDLQQAFRATLSRVITYVVQKGQLLQNSTVLCYNKMIMDENHNK